MFTRRLNLLRPATAMVILAVAGYVVVVTDFVPLPFLTSRSAAIATALRGRESAHVMSAQLESCRDSGLCSQERWLWRVNLDRGGFNPSGSTGPGILPHCVAPHEGASASAPAIVWVGHLSGKVVQEVSLRCT